MKTVSLDLGSLRVIADTSKDLKNWNRIGENVAGVTNKKSSTSTYVFIFGIRRDRTRKTEQRKAIKFRF